ncbi:MAG: type VI secretion system tip protein VgrG [Bacteroidota bacterium]|nr:type VI secretion system tip protein VgrG [Bacteroidota bacterium]
MPEIPTLEQTIKASNLISMELLIDGKDMSLTYQIVTITIQQEINKIPAARILIMDGEVNKGDFAASSSNDFKPGKEIEIKLGYTSENDTVFKGIIISNAIKINNDCSELNIEAKDETTKMTITKGNNHFTGISDIEIANELLKQNNITNTDINVTTPKHKQLVQSNITDWDYMISRIDVNSLFCVIDNTQVIIKKPDKEGDAKLKLTYGYDIIELHTEMDSRIQNAKVTTSVWDFKKQEVSNEDSETTTIKDESEASVDDLAGVANKPYQIKSSVSLTQEEIKAIADSKKQKQELSKIKGSVKYQGTKAVKAGDFILIEDIGINFTGKIFVSAIQHEYAGGDWTTEATLGWNEQFFAEQINSQNAASATGQVSNIQGLQSAIVTDITDSEGEFRVKVRLPAVNDQDEGIYARVATLDAGNNRGTFFRPELHDEVIVGFMNNDASHPVILGMLHSNTKASPIQPESANNVKGYVSRSEVKILIDDGEKSITIETQGGNKFFMSDTENKISLSDANGNKITMEPSGITIDAAKVLTLKAGTSLAISAPQLSMKADGEMKLEGGATSTVSSNGIVNIKGSIVNIN